MKKPSVALLGRANVGKSTIFNKFIKKRKSIVLDKPGVTRDRIYEDAEFKDYKFRMIDTGGIELNKLKFSEEIKLQAEIAAREADVIVFVVDGKEGLTSEDLFIRDILREYENKVIVAINKTDSKEFQDHRYDFYELGFDEYYEISAENNLGMYELADAIVKNFEDYQYQEDNNLKISIVGRPNVGKSSIVNAMLNEKRVIVSEVSGTTRDSIDTILEVDGEKFNIVDTAGLRRKGRVYEEVEKYSYLRSLKAIDDSDISLLVIDGVEGITEQDKHIAGYILEKGKGIIILVNKWDLKTSDKGSFNQRIKRELQFIDYAPVIYTSALTKEGINKIIPTVKEVEESINKRIKTSIINEVISDAYMMKLPPTYKGKRLKIYYVSQVSTKPPHFIFSVNDRGLVHFSYERYLENRIRDNFSFKGTPIILEFKNRSNKEL